MIPWKDFTFLTSTMETKKILTLKFNFAAGSLHIYNYRQTFLSTLYIEHREQTLRQIWATLNDTKTVNYPSYGCK
mgnify:CR=1 FL=1